MKKIHLLPLAILSFILMVGVVQAQPPPQTCEPIWKEILDSVSRASCRDFDNDFACYGHGQLYVSYLQDISQDQIKSFSSPGDRSPLAVFSQITTTPLDYDSHSYGVGVLRFAAVAPADKEAYLVGTKSGDSVQFILYGDAYLQPNLAESNISTSSDVKTIPRLPGFYFYTGMSSEPQCIDLQGSLPEGGLLVQSPQGMKVKFTANGANITIGSSVLLQAEPNRTMAISVIEGQALVEVPGYLPMPLSRSQQTIISLGGANGLQAVGAPGVPSTITTNPPGILSVCQLADLVGFYNPCNTVNTVSTSRPSAPDFTNGQAMMVSANPNALLRKNPAASSVDKTWPVDYGHCVRVNDPKSQWNTSENQYWVQVSTEDKKHSGWVETNSLSKPKDPIATVSKAGNVRSGDDKSFRLITSLRVGDKVTLLGLSSRGTGWYYIRLSNGTEGWISPSLITVPNGICSLSYIRPPDIVAAPVKPQEPVPDTITPIPTIDLPPITIIVPSPKPSFTVTTTKMGIICANDAAIMQFHNNSSNAVSYSWDFGDNTPRSNEVNPSHAYQAAGAHSGDNYFTVILYATNQFGTTENFKLNIAVPFHNLC